MVVGTPVSAVNTEYPLIIAGDLKKGLWQLSPTAAGGGRSQRHKVKKAAGGVLQTGAGGAVIVVCYISD